MNGFVTVALLGVLLWLGALTLWVRRLDPRSSGDVGRGRRRTREAEKVPASVVRITDLVLDETRPAARVPVQLRGFLHVTRHARPCEVLDLSRSGARVRVEGGDIPVGEEGSLEIEFDEFQELATRAKVVRKGDDGRSYGLEFVEPSTGFLRRCLSMLGGPRAE